MRRPLGCLTFSALVAAVLAVIVIAAVAAATGNGIFSRGELSGISRGNPVGGVASHADLAGRCDACHAPAWSTDTMGDRCLACHTQVRQEITSKGGFHGRLLATTSNCRDCHTDHRGVAAELTLADPRVFPHAQTGYDLGAHPLRGQGGSFSCRDCHPASLVTFTASTCAACHQPLDPPRMTLHVETFGAACLDCHDGVDSYGATFKHATYALVGGHAKAQCGSCHRGATTLAALRAAPTACLACHAARDVHQGSLGTSCGDCHATDSWAGASINHDRTRLPLVGLHVGASCEACHVNRQWTGIGLTCRSCHAGVNPHGDQFPGDCAACHVATGWKNLTFSHASTRFPLVVAHDKPACVACHPAGRYVGTPTSCVGCHGGIDPHKGTFGSDCATCHSTAAWLPASFDHSKTSFQLTGAHVGVTCQGCHTGGQYTGTATTCAACHAKPLAHGSAFSGTCASCHSTAAWLPASFNHSKTSFQLTGGHAGVVCQSCHVGGQYTGTPTTCAACHTKPVSHGSAFAGICSACHSTKAWLPASFDHSKTSFQLTGGHAGVVCQSCHVGGQYTGTPTTCAACHTKPVSHGSAFAGICSACHSTKAWLPASFDHSKTSFQLTGGHAGVVCQSCHVGGQYTGTPTTCAACHTKPVSHGSAFAGICSACHSTKAWLPATFDHSKASFQLTGGHAGVACERCHAGGQYQGTPTACASCHTKPASHGTAYGTNCASCHSVNAWLPATFDHSKASFQLTGAHLNVACQSCHVGGQYQGTPTACASCHTKPASHDANFAGLCSSCHTTSAWLPASYNGPHAFPMSHGGAGGVCAKCHPSSLASYSCASCHSNSSMTSHHSGVSGFSLTTCASCHPNGRGGG